jgi:hypothetical protein
MLLLADNSLHIFDKRGVMITPESIAALAADLEWKPWAEKGWTLHPAPGGRVIAVNGVLGRATANVAHIETLMGQLERGAFTYKKFLVFKKHHTP